MFALLFRPNFYNSGDPEDMQSGNMMSPGHNPQHPPPASPGSMGCPFPGQSPPKQLPPQGFGQSSSTPSPILPGQDFQGNLQQMSFQNPQMNQQGASFQSMPEMQKNVPFQTMGQIPSEFFKNLFSSQTLGLGGKTHFIVLFVF